MMPGDAGRDLSERLAQPRAGYCVGHGRAPCGREIEPVLPKAGGK
jgi:hypothetical protein